jgi:hypothetical protein
MAQKPAPKGFKWVYCRSYVHPKSRKRIYARSGKVFAFLVPT